MKKQVLIINILAASLIGAQSNENLNRKFEKQKTENNQKFDLYIAKQYENQKTQETLNEIQGKRNRLAGFTPDGKPFFIEAEDFRQIKNTNADYLQNGTIAGLTGTFNGENIKYTVFDGGRAYQDHILFNNLSNRITNKEAATLDYSSHATAVSSFIGSKDYTYSGYNFKGVAPNSTFDNYAFATTTLPGNTATSDKFQKILLAQPKISNHSYGVNAGWGARTYNGADVWLWSMYYNAGIHYDLQGTYYNDDQGYDQIVYENPSYVIVKSSGNYFDQGPAGNTLNKYYYNAAGALTQFSATDVLPPNNCALGYDCIGPGSLAKNIIVVGATDIITTNDNRYTNSTDVIHSYYSSAGPRDDGGIKPDISTTGTNVASAASTAAGSNSISVGSGTSYAAPVVTGIIGLWMQIYKTLFYNADFNAASAKTLMVHSASEAGNIGPDPWFGWGYIDAKKGAELLVGKSNNTIIYNDETLNNATVNTKNLKASGNEPLKVTISWIDPAYSISSGISWVNAHNNRSSRLVNDLDLRVIDTTDNTIYYPWKLNANSPMTPATKADNTVDNVEQVIVDAPVTGRTYRIEVTNKGTLVNSSGGNAPQNYSILVTGYSEELLTTQEISNENTITIAPTVTKDIVNILKAPTKSTFTVYDLSGKKLQNGTIKNSHETIGLTDYPKGIYIIKIKIDKNIIIKKVIKE